MHGQDQAKLQCMIKLAAIVIGEDIVSVNQLYTDLILKKLSKTLNDPAHSPHLEFCLEFGVAKTK